MKLSEAILLGSVGSRQGRGIHSIVPQNKDSHGLCAMGSALLACGIKEADEWTGMAHIRSLYPWVRNYMVQPPVPVIAGHTGKVDVISIIWRLNDRCHWTRPQIAEWVASIEPQEEGEVIACNINLAVQPLDTVSQA